METQDWEGKQLDKDLLVYKNKVYSPDTCVFISQKLNIFITKGRNNKDTPIGVSYRKNQRTRSEELKPYTSAISSKEKRTPYHGSYTTALEAHRVWQRAKLLQILEFIATENEDLVVKGLRRVFNKIKTDYDLGLETEDF